MKKFYKSRVDKLVRVAEKVNRLRREMDATKELLNALCEIDHAFVRVNTFGQTEIVFTKYVEGMHQAPFPNVTVHKIANYCRMNVCEELEHKIEVLNDRIADTMGKVEFARSLDIDKDDE